VSTPEESAPPPAMPSEPVPGSAPDDADDLRGVYFKQLLSGRLTWALILGATIAAGVAAAVFIGAAIGAGAAVAVFLISLLVAFGIADSRAEEAFFQIYARQHGLELGGRAPLPATTPLLRKGDDRYAERTLSGPIGAGIEGILALYTYEEESRDSDGNKETNYYRYTVGLVPVAESAALVPELYCQRKSGLRALEKFEDVFRGSKERVNLESTAMGNKYEVFANKDQDAVWLRRLFAPTFIVWLTEAAPKKFAFELVGGTLCCYVSGHKKRAEELDEISAATAAVAQRLRDESLETSS
jgi:hypothetical protein